MPEAVKHRFACEHCLDRGWVIEAGFSPAFESRAEVVPCPECRPEPEPTRGDHWWIAAFIIAIFLVAFLLV